MNDEIPNRVLAIEARGRYEFSLFRPQAREPGRAAAGADRSHLDYPAKLGAVPEKLK